MRQLHTVHRALRPTPLPSRTAQEAAAARACQYVRLAQGAQGAPPGAGQKNPEGGPVCGGSVQRVTTPPRPGFAVEHGA
jgi:hypothetical protein